MLSSSLDQQIITAAFDSRVRQLTAASYVLQLPALPRSAVHIDLPGPLNMYGRSRRRRELPYNTARHGVLGCQISAAVAADIQTDFDCQLYFKRFDPKIGLHFYCSSFVEI